MVCSSFIACLPGPTPLSFLALTACTIQDAVPTCLADEAASALWSLQGWEFRRISYNRGHMLGLVYPLFKKRKKHVGSQGLSQTIPEQECPMSCCRQTTLFLALAPGRNSNDIGEKNFLRKSWRWHLASPWCTLNVSSRTPDAGFCIVFLFVQILWVFLYSRLHHPSPREWDREERSGCTWPSQNWLGRPWP